METAPDLRPDGAFLHTGRRCVRRLPPVRHSSGRGSRRRSQQCALSPGKGDRAAERRGRSFLPDPSRPSGTRPDRRSRRRPAIQGRSSPFSAALPQGRDRTVCRRRSRRIGCRAPGNAPSMRGRPPQSSRRAAVRQGTGARAFPGSRCLPRGRPYRHGPVPSSAPAVRQVRGIFRFSSG